MHVRKITYLIIAALALATAAGASGASSAGTATAALSTSQAGAKRVTLTISLRTELRCGRLAGSGPLVLGLPAKAHVASAMPATAVLVGGKAAGRVVVAGHTLTVSLPPPRGMMCDTIRMGIAKVVVLPAAGFANPKAPGAYTVTVRHGSETFAAPLTIR
jgi:hypothetical protein